ncbi:Dipeptide transport ATP-binding protein dppF [Streptococcus pyogenes]|nr:Dipeptide transport ATP-binding protein dppF [Streptococcus pyogenes]
MTLEAKKLGFYHKKDQWLFKEIDLEVAPGQILGIFGQSGVEKRVYPECLLVFCSLNLVKY